MRKIYTYYNNGECPVSLFFDKAKEKIRKKFLFQLEYIRDNGNVLCEPYVKHFSIEKYRRLYEIRVKADGTMVRIIFYEQENEIFLLHAFYKKDKKDTEKALKTSLKLLTSISENNKIIKQYVRDVGENLHPLFNFKNRKLGGN